MKWTYITLITSILITIGTVQQSNAQTVAGIPLEEIKSEYIFVNPVGRLLNNRINLSIQYGQEIRMQDMRDSGLLGADGKPIPFYSIVQGLNYLYEYGYEYEDAIIDPTGGSATYVLKRSQE